METKTAKRLKTPRRGSEYCVRLALMLSGTTDGQAKTGDESHACMDNIPYSVVRLTPLTTRGGRDATVTTTTVEREPAVSIFGPESSANPSRTPGP